MMLEVIRRFIVASLWIVGGVIAFGVTGSDQMPEQLYGLALFAAIIFALHMVINWIFAGAKKKTPENRSPREPDF